jgi:hypothetical protein
MKLSALVLTILFAAPSMALAQQGPPPDGGHPGMMRGGPEMKQMMQEHQAFRHQVLAALTPAHKELLANVAGQLAVADKPDYKAAAAKLDAALSSGEKQTILAAQSQMMAQMKAQWEQMKTAWASAHPGETPRPQRSPRPEHSPRTPDAGMVLLMVAGGHGMMGHGYGHGPRRN